MQVEAHLPHSELKQLERENKTLDCPRKLKHLSIKNGWRRSALRLDAPNRWIVALC